MEETDKLKRMLDDAIKVEREVVENTRAMPEVLKILKRLHPEVDLKK